MHQALFQGLQIPPMVVCCNSEGNQLDLNNCFVINQNKEAPRAQHQQNKCPRTTDFAKTFLVQTINLLFSAH